MASKRGGHGGYSAANNRDPSRISKGERIGKPRITRLGSFQDDTEAILMEASSSRTGTNRNVSHDNPVSSDPKRRLSPEKIKIPKQRVPLELHVENERLGLPDQSAKRRVAETGEQRGSGAMKKPLSPPPFPAPVEDRPPKPPDVPSKRKSQSSHKSPPAGKTPRGRPSGTEIFGGYRPTGTTFMGRTEDSRSIRSDFDHADSQNRLDTKSPLSLPPRTSFAPRYRTSQIIARMQKRAQLPVINKLFPMYPSRPCITAGRGTRVELHVHLEGSVRYETIWELMKMKKMALPGDGSVRAIRDAISVTEPVHPSLFFEPIPIYLQSFVGDLNALERIAYEFCEDKVREGVLYVEVRYSPRMLLGNKLPLPRGRFINDLGEVVMAINRGFRVGEREFGIVVRTILCLVAGWSGSGDVVTLIQQFQDDGVVGIDLHVPYDESHRESALPGMSTEEVPLWREEMKTFMQAAHLGISRTVHAGLLGSAYMVQRGIEKYRAQRIGHGYEVLKLPQLYQKSKERNVHFECCPWMSLLSCSVDATDLKHPIAQFAEDGVNFSLNTSHPTLTGLTLQEEYDLVSSWGLTEYHLVRSNINALRSSFLQQNEKSSVMKMLLENIGIKRRSKK